MADYTDLPDTAVGIGGIPSGTTVTALRDNPIAIAEGAVGAPRIVDAALDVTVAYYGGKIAQFSAGSVGSYAFLRRPSGVEINPGGTVAGSSLTYSDSGDNDSAISPSGTWRCLGYSPFGITSSTLWLRIS